MRTPEYPSAELTLLHISDTHLRAAGSRLFDVIDGADRLARALRTIEQSGVRPDAIVFTGDLADLGEEEAYTRLRGLVDDFAGSHGHRVFWVMGNHDDRAGFRAGLLDDASGSTAPIDRVDEVDGLRIITLDSTVPGHHHGALSDAQLAWLADVLATPAPRGSILAMHHPPVPSVLPLAASVELRDQARLATVLRGSDVRAVIAGHLHYSTFASFAGIPVSVASSTCYAQDLTVPVGGTRPQDGAQAYNLVHVYSDTIVHSVVPVDVTRTLEHIDADEARRRLRAAGVRTDVTPERADRAEPVPL